MKEKMMYCATSTDLMKELGITPEDFEEREEKKMRRWKYEVVVRYLGREWCTCATNDYEEALEEVENLIWYQNLDAYIY